MLAVLNQLLRSAGDAQIIFHKLCRPSRTKTSHVASAVDQYSRTSMFNSTIAIPRQHAKEIAKF